MDEIETGNLADQAKAVLAANDRGGWTMPAGELYPHQWLWDSCFIAIGLAHVNTARAQTEITSLLRGQWSNGMMPNIIFNDDPKHRREHNIWQSWLSPDSPTGILTSGITQPPLLAEAVVRIGQKLKLPERRLWYKSVYGDLVRYHQWLYRERSDDHGLIILIHPYESGIDNSPAWAAELHYRAWPWWLKAAQKARLDNIVSLVRRDTHHVASNQRSANADAIAHWALLRRLRYKAYDSREILKNPKIAVADLAFNSILIRANSQLKEIAKVAGLEVPEDLKNQIQSTKQALEQLWDESAEQYFSGSVLGKTLIAQPSIAALLPLYSGTISQQRAEQLVAMLNRRGQFKASWPVPSVPLNSSYFNPVKYWQGPSWVNTNWLIIDGLRRYGYTQEADELRNKTLKMVAKSGCYEYFNPLNGDGLGASDFSWTAALTLDLLKD